MKKWHDRDFDGFINDDEAKEKVLSYISQHQKAKKTGTGLFLYGENGIGKTHLMMCALKELMELGYTTQVITMGTLITKFASSWYNSEESIEFKRHIQSVHFLGIEEIGKEYKSGTNDLALMVLDSVVRYRLQNNAPVLFTTNLSPKAIENKYSGDIASMLCESCIPIHVTGIDMRPKILSKNKKEFNL